jgi:dolichol-phosphate mannosyltransferase
VKRTRLITSLRTPRNWGQLAQFCVVGGIGFVINLAVYRALVRNGVEFHLAAVYSFLVAVTTNYALNRVWTFREHRRHIGGQAMRFFAVSVASFGVGQGVLHLMVEGAGTTKLVGQAIALVVVTPLNFIGNKLWSFRRHRT